MYAQTSSCLFSTHACHLKVLKSGAHLDWLVPPGDLRTIDNEIVDFVRGTPIVYCRRFGRSSSVGYLSHLEFDFQQPA